MKSLTQSVREILMAAKTTEGVYFSEIVGHANVVLENFEVNEVASLIVTGLVPNLDDSMDEELAAIWLHRYNWGWIVGLDSGDQYAIFN